ncbi:hypothetical protein FNV43_RR25080 [Rhamnella rubrinervis]|uniref:LRAT domain-containing protein n=1 Tax=Rhamnella rubrinervis TaxID=2594499 RepID=A0A8K0GLU4_9ROSA|nr:hypothetical protein FNV43_RR25080 [Rhamnella rubrinervis]
MGLLSGKVRREQLNSGINIYTCRNSYSYSHHGIYVGDGKVIHLTRAPGLIIFSSSDDHESSPSHPPADRVECCSIEEFLTGGDFYLYAYGAKSALFLIKRGVPVPVPVAIHLKMYCTMHLCSWKRASVTITFSITTAKTLQSIAKQDC